MLSHTQEGGHWLCSTVIQWLAWLTYREGRYVLAYNVGALTHHRQASLLWASDWLLGGDYRDGAKEAEVRLDSQTHEE